MFVRTLALRLPLDFSLGTRYIEYSFTIGLMSISLCSIHVTPIIFIASSVSLVGVIVVSGMINARVFSFNFLLQMYVNTAESIPPLTPKIIPFALFLLISLSMNSSILLVMDS